MSRIPQLWKEAIERKKKERQLEEKRCQDEKILATKIVIESIEKYIEEVINRDFYDENNMPICTLGRIPLSKQLVDKIKFCGIDMDYFNRCFLENGMELYTDIDDYEKISVDLKE